MPRRLLFVDDEETIRVTLAAVLRKHGYKVSTAASVAEALQKITAESFDVLLSDLNIGNPGDGLTVISAMRRTQPEAVTMILTGYPAFETALEAIRQQVDDYIVKPANIPALVNALERRLASPTRQRQPAPLKRVAMILQEHAEQIEKLWLSFAEEDKTLSQTHISRQERLNYVRRLLEVVIRAAQSYSGEPTTEPPIHSFGDDASALTECTPRMMLTHFCLLRRAIAQVIQENLLAVNLSYLVPDLARVNESLDEQAQAALTTLAGGANATR